MSSGTLAALPFAPDADTLQAALELLATAGERSGDAVAPAIRRDALARYRSLPVPGGRPGRTWRHDYAKLAFEDLSWGSDRVRMPVTPPAPPPATPAGEPEPDVDHPALATDNAGGLFHVGARYLEPVAPSGDPRVIVIALADAADHDAVAAYHLQIADWRGDKFGALATAFQNCGAFVYVPAGVQLDAPIQVVFSNDGAADEAVFPHVLVVAEAGARATVIERFVGDADPFVCGLVEVVAAEGAHIDYVAVQQSGEGARVFMQRAARAERSATVRWHLAELGGTLARTTIATHLAGEDARGETSALFFNTGMQHVDLLTGADHTVPNTASDTVVRSAATDRGQGRYVGNIVIRGKAHGSEASLRDDALLLSKRAHIDSVPALEIAANDVRAFHGATVGSLDEEALFYVGSRGIPRPEALRLVALGFFEPAVSRFPSDALRDEIRTALDRKLDAATEIDG